MNKHTSDMNPTENISLLELETATGAAATDSRTVGTKNRVTTAIDPYQEYFSEQQNRRFVSMFQQFDINKDGQVSPRELQKALKSMNIKVDLKICKAMINEFSEEGYMDSDTFMEIVTVVFQEGYLDPKDYGVELAEEQAEYDFEVLKERFDKELTNIFYKFDKDGSGNISKLEFKECAKELGQDMSDADVDQFMEKADTDKDGQIDIDEFLKFFREKYQA